MYAIIIAAFQGALTWLLSSSVLRFFVIAALAYLVEVLVQFAIGALPSVTGLCSSIQSALPASVHYALDIFEFQTGLALIVAAVAVRFFIRRIPLIG